MYTNIVVLQRGCLVKVEARGKTGSVTGVGVGWGGKDRRGSSPAFHKESSNIREQNDNLSSTFMPSDITECQKINDHLVFIQVRCEGLSFVVIVMQYVRVFTLLTYKFIAHHLAQCSPCTVEVCMWY